MKREHLNDLFLALANALGNLDLQDITFIAIKLSN